MTSIGTHANKVYLTKIISLLFGFFIAGNLIGSVVFKSQPQTPPSETVSERFESDVYIGGKSLSLRILLDERREKEIASPEKFKFKTLEFATSKRKRSSDDKSLPKVFRFKGRDAFVSSAFVDFRFRSCVMRTFMVHKSEEKHNLYCHIKIPSGTITLKSRQMDIFHEWPENSLYLASAYYFEVPLTWKTKPNSAEFSLTPTGHRINVTLHSVAPHEAGITDREARVGVCVKAIVGKYPEKSLVEWTEFHRVIGADVFMFYNASLTGPGNQVLQYYVDEGIAEVTQFPLQKYILEFENQKQHLNRGEKYSTEQQTYLLSILDCLYRYTNRFKYILVLDLDELLTPTKQEKLIDLVKRGWKSMPPASGLMFKTGWYFSDFNQDDFSQDSVLTMASKVIRTPIKDNQPKSVIDTDKFLLANWHGVLTVPNSSGYLLNNFVPPDDGYIHHFRGNCIDKFYKKDCKVMLKEKERDLVLPRYAAKVKANVEKVLELISFEP